MFITNNWITLLVVHFSIFTKRIQKKGIFLYHKWAQQVNIIFG